MARGGYRPGGGRPPGARNKKPSKARQRQAAAQALPIAEAEETVRQRTPLNYMLGVMRDPAADPLRRDRMAIAAAPFVHKRTADAPEGAKAAAAKRAKALSTGRFATPPTPLRLVANNRPDPDDEAG
jgi:phage terminase small subunit